MPKLTVNFNGKESSEFGLYLADFDPLVYPGNSDQYIELPNLDGSHLFPGIRKDRIIPVTFIYEGGLKLTDVNLVRQQMAAWLDVSERAPLIFSGEPDKMYMAKPNSVVPFSYAGLIKGDAIPIAFRCAPHAYSAEEIDEPLAITTTLHNPGTAEAEALIVLTVNSSVQNVGVTNTTTGEGFTITGTLQGGTTIEVDAGYITRKTVKINDQNGLGQFSGKWLVLAPGDNVISLSNSNVTARILYRAKWK